MAGDDGAAPSRPRRSGRSRNLHFASVCWWTRTSAESRLARHGAAHPDAFDDSLHAALTHFQSRNAIDEDGALGANTLRESNHSVQDRIADLRLNLDRWRWLPRELGARYIVVNVAGFELEMIEEGRPTAIMNVVVGKEGWNTPIFADTMEYLVVNPSWNVPASIAQAEVLPALQRDPGYLAARHMDVLLGERVVDVSSVNLSSEGTYRFRQRPGPDNALGRLKFMLPNSYNIYLHDSPAGQLFSLTDRAFSHGCIRLEKPEQLARALCSASPTLRQKGWTRSSPRAWKRRSDSARACPSTFSTSPHGLTRTAPCDFCTMSTAATRISNPSARKAGAPRARRSDYRPGQRMTLTGRREPPELIEQP